MSQAIDDAYHLAKMICFTNNSPKEVLDKTNYETVSEIRHILIYFLYVDFEWSKARISRAMQRHHASVGNSIKRYKSLVDSSPKFRDMAAEYRDLIYEGFLALAAIA